MKTIARLILVAALASGSGCARPGPDWIEQTLVTADVTGTWRGEVGFLDLALAQEGPNVTGSMFLRVTNIRGTVAGTVNGDVFRFKQTGGVDIGYGGELTVSGDEMTGNVRSSSGRPVPVLLRRVTSP